jgi:hypothetical protein
MKGLQRTCASARYTRLIVLPRFLCIWLRNSPRVLSRKKPDSIGLFGNRSRKIRDPNLRRNPRPHRAESEPSRHTCIRRLPGHIVMHYYWIELAADEKTLFALEPTNRIVPTTRTRITANITAYSAMSWASSSRHAFQNKSNMCHHLSAKYASRTVSNREEGWATAENI